MSNQMVNTANSTAAPRSWSVRPFDLSATYDGTSLHAGMSGDLVPTRAADRVFRLANIGATKQASPPRGEPR